MNNLRQRGLHKSLRRTTWERVREHFWPSMGFAAWCRWVWLTLVRQSHKPHEVALGVAIGVWTIFFPILGTHMLLSVAVCWLLGGSVLAALIGCWVGNPWTYPVIWWLSLKLGRHLLGMAVTAPRPVYDLDLGMLWHNLETFAGKMLWPMLVGGQLLAVPLSVLIYFGIYWQMRRWRRKKRP